MGIDITILVLLALAMFNGFKKGLVVALFSLLALIVGAAAALKLSGVAAAWLMKTAPEVGKWVPLLAFLLVFVAAVIVVRLVAKLIEEALEWTMLGWANKLGGVVFYALLYMMVASIGLFYLDKLGFLSAEVKSTSVTYSGLQPLAPTIMKWTGKIIPVFTDLFEELESIFEQLAPSTPAL
jgi:membrane protein required for colicin V production